MALLPVIILHGGAAQYSQEFGEKRLTGVCKASKVGWQLLADGANALDAVQRAMVVMEDWPALNAGTGSQLTVDGNIEMDAAIMDGRTMDAGGVTCVKNIRNPINLARAVLDKTEHVLLAGEGANKFATELGVPTVSAESLLSEYSRRQWAEYNKYRVVVNNFFSPEASSQDGTTIDKGHDTVGAAAVDRDGNIAAATSTGGITAKMCGRVGDSPIIGSGVYADNSTCGVSTTGHGESIMRVCLAKHIAMLTQVADMSLPAACQAGISYMESKVVGGGGAGVVAVSGTGEFAHHFNTKRMPWVVCSREQKLYGLNPGESYTLDLEQISVH